MSDARFALIQDIAYGFIFGVGGMTLLVAILSLIFGATIATPIVAVAWALGCAIAWLSAFGFLHFKA